MFWTAHIHSSASPRARTAARLQALRHKSVPGAFHYETPRQARLWMELHEALSPARPSGVVAGLYHQAAQSLAERLPDKEVWIVGLGCGSGHKDRLLVQACRARGLKVHYAPVDISLPLVLTAAEAVAPWVLESGGRLLPVVADLTAEENWRDWWAAQASEGKACIITFYGMLPTLAPAEVRQCLGRWLRPGCWLLLSANLMAEEAERGIQRILPQYDNELTRRWLSVFWEDLGVPLNTGALRFYGQQQRGVPSVWAIVAEWEFQENVALAVDGESFRFSTRERLQLWASYRYLPGQVAEMIQPLGQRLKASWLDADGAEGVFLCGGPPVGE